MVYDSCIAALGFNALTIIFSVIYYLELRNARYVYYECKCFLSCNVQITNLIFVGEKNEIYNKLLEHCIISNNK